jgi:hypothetical protein
MAKRTRLGYEGYGVRRAGSFAGKVATVIVLAQIADVSVTDGVVTALSAADGRVTAVTVADGVVTVATLTEWPV